MQKYDFSSKPQIKDMAFLRQLHHFHPIVPSAAILAWVYSRLPLPDQHKREPEEAVSIFYIKLATKGNICCHLLFPNASKFATDI